LLTEERKRAYQEAKGWQMAQNRGWNKRHAGRILNILLAKKILGIPYLQR